MRDEDFEYFIQKFGEATTREVVPPSQVDTWRGRLPEQLLSYWQEEGWCGYADGLFWTVNPDDYEDIVEAWLSDTPFERIDRYHIIARTAFGKLYACGENTGTSLTMNCPLHSLIALQSELKRSLGAEGLDENVRGFFCSASSKHCDLKDEGRKPLYARALQKLGPLAVDEMYGFVPALAAGGRLKLENLERVQLHPHLMILRQLAEPTVPFLDIDIDALMAK